MKVLLVSPNIESLPDPVFPIGAAYIAAVLKSEGVDCRILDLCFVEDYEAAIRDELETCQPDFIGLSLRNLDNVSYPNYISYLPFYLKVVQTIRQYSPAPVLLGGSALSLLPEEILKYLGADMCIMGEGELSFVGLVQRLRETGDPASYVKPRIIGPTVIEDLDRLPAPDRSAFDNEGYLKWGGMGNIQTKRGCPFQCIYCTYPIIEGKKMRLRSPSLVCDEMEDLVAQGIDSLFIVDNAFNYPPEHAEAVCREMIRRRIPLRWSCYVNPGFVTPGLMDLMRDAGCTGVEFGSDAAQPDMLFGLGKNFTVEDLRRASKNCLETSIPFCHSLLLGGPGETLETVRETLVTVLEMSPTAAICMVGIRVFPGTRLSRRGMKDGVLGPEEDYLGPVFYLSPAVEQEILPFLEDFSRDHPTWIFPGLNINMNETLQRKLRRFGIKGPLWEQMARARRKSS